MIRILGGLDNSSFTARKEVAPVVVNQAKPGLSEKPTSTKASPKPEKTSEAKEKPKAAPKSKTAPKTPEKAEKTPSAVKPTVKEAISLILVNSEKSAADIFKELTEKYGPYNRTTLYNALKDEKKFLKIESEGNTVYKLV